MCEAPGAVEAEGFEAAVAEHFEDLGVFLGGGLVGGVEEGGRGGCGKGCKRTLAFFFEGQLSLLVVVLVLAPASVFTTLEEHISASLSRPKPDI